MPAWDETRFPANAAKTANTQVLAVQQIAADGSIGSGGFDAGEDAQRVVISQRQPETEVVSSVSAGSAANGTFDFEFDLRQFPFNSIQMANKAGAGTVTVTVGASNEPIADASAATYVDVTNTLYGAASLTADGFLIRDTLTPFRFIQIKIVVASSDGATAYDVWLQKYPGGQS